MAEAGRIDAERPLERVLKWLIRQTWESGYPAQSARGEPEQKFIQTRPYWTIPSTALGAKKRRESTWYNWKWRWAKSQTHDAEPAPPINTVGLALFIVWSFANQFFARSLRQIQKRGQQGLARRLHLQCSPQFHDTTRLGVGNSVSYLN